MQATAAVAEGEERQAGHHRLAHVQGLRGLAVLLVVLYHAGLPVQAGFVGVDIFFVISGFVITRLLYRESREHGRVRFSQFYRRRVRRLLPAFALATSVTVVLAGVLQSPIGAQHDTGMVGLGGSLWLANAAIYAVTLGYFGADPSSIPLLHTWSLAVEEQFYLVFPLLIAIGFSMGRNTRRGRRGGARRVLRISLVLSFLLSLLLCYGVANGHPLAYLASPTRAWEFVAGALVAVRANRRAAPRPGRARALGILGLVLMVGSAVLLPMPLEYPGFPAVLPVVGAVLVLGACSTPGTFAERALSFRPLLHLGDLSYSWYLWHWPLITFAALLFDRSKVAMAVAAAVSYPIALLAYHRVEQPIRRREPTRRFATLGMVGACVAVPFALSAGLLVGSSSSWGRSDIEDLRDQLYDRTDEIASSCLSRTLLTARGFGDCTVPGNEAARPVLLVGDSNAWQYTDGLVVAARSLDRTLVVATVGGCPLIDIEIHERAVSWEYCQEFYAAAMEWLEDRPPSTVVVASANRFIDDDDLGLAPPGEEEASTDPEDKARLWEEGLVRTFERLLAAGHQVLQVNVSPHLYRDGDDHVPWHPRQCSFPELLGDVADCGLRRPRAEVDGYQGPGLRAEHAAAEAVGIQELDLRDRICDPRTCTTNRGSDRLLQDGRHITPQLARRLGPDFVEALAALDDADAAEEAVAP